MSQDPDIEITTEMMLRSQRHWNGETICMKKQPRGDEVAGVMGYSAFGVLVSTQLPLVIYLREDFVHAVEYASVEACIEAGWEVD